ncbi:hypothetical protein [Paraclostridium sordellii]|uniref:hypothetical protein n=1 Tax=Paraclostridium sordellii TaxID=1505 RepID=UPI0022E702A7|nr:hypothetical protein [Paeniclostridium sordellii]
MLTTEVEKSDLIIDKRIVEVENIVKIYTDEVEKELKNVCDEIKKEIKLILEKYSDEYELILENSVYNDLYLFDISERVKNPESLKHKLISKNLIKGIDCNDKEKIKDYIIKVDDIIGIKILTNLSKDRKSILNLLKEKSMDFKSKEICLDEKDIDNMPEKMKNGRDIYKIKGIYKELYKFELQIKSKIDSAWGDLEHNLFYKDYEFNYIKDNNKKIMNNIGDLLEQIEKLLLTVRESKSKFNEDYELMKVKKSISDKYSKYIEEKFKTKSIFEIYLYRICTIYQDMKNLEDDILDIDRFKNISDIEQRIDYNNNNLFKNFQKIKLDNIHLAMIEIIFLGITDKENYEDLVELILKYFLRFNIRESRKKLSLQEGDDLLPDIYEPIIKKIKEFEIENISSRAIVDDSFIAAYINLKYKIEEKIDVEIIDDINDDEDKQESLKNNINNIITRYILDKHIEEIEDIEFDSIFTMIGLVKKDINNTINGKIVGKEKIEINKMSLNILSEIENELKEREGNE